MAKVNTERQWPTYLTSWQKGGWVGGWSKEKGHRPHCERTGHTDEEIQVQISLQAMSFIFDFVLFPFVVKESISQKYLH